MDEITIQRYIDNKSLVEITFSNGVKMTGTMSIEHVCLYSSDNAKISDMIMFEPYDLYRESAKREEDGSPVSSFKNRLRFTYLCGHRPKIEININQICWIRLLDLM